MQSPVIVALDFETKLQAMELVRQLGPEASFYKVGLQLLTEDGPSTVRELVDMGKEIFLCYRRNSTPGATGNDQVRVSTPACAREAGATHAVIDRSISRSSNPREAFAEALAGMRRPSGA